MAESFFLCAFAEFHRRWDQSTGTGTGSEPFGLRMERAGRALGDTAIFAKNRAADVARGSWSSDGGGDSKMAVELVKKAFQRQPSKKKLPSLQLTDLSAL